jgi:hypothetical protein
VEGEQSDLFYARLKRAETDVELMRIEGEGRLPAIRNNTPSFSAPLHFPYSGLHFSA